MILERIVSDGLIACIPFSMVVWGSFFSLPRIWLHSLPEDIQAMVAPKTTREKRWTVIVGILIIVTFFAVPIALTWRWNAEQTHNLSFVSILLHLYGVWLIVNVWDLIVIDWGYAFIVDPNRPPIAGSEGAKGYKDYRFHLNSSLKACVLSLIVIIPAAVLISLA